MFKIPSVRFGRLCKIGQAFLVNHSADILTAATSLGVILTAVETGRATLKAHEYLEINGYEQANPDTKKVLKMNAAKFYILPATIGAGTIGAAIGANHINHQKIAGLAAACTIAETALQENREKIEELLGEKAIKQLDTELNLDRAEKYLQSDDILMTGHGEVLCCEGYFTGKLFRASPDWVRKCVNEFNERVNYETYCSCAEYLELLWRDHLSNVVIPSSTDNLGYNVHQNGLLRLEMTSDIDPTTGEPYLIFRPINAPIANFMEIF